MLRVLGALAGRLVSFSVAGWIMFSRLSLLLLPLLVRNRQESGIRSMSRTLRLALVLFLSGSALYLALLWGLRLELFRFFYAGKYQEYASWPLLLVGLLPFAASVTAMLGSALRALERPDRAFWSYIGTSIAALLAGVPLGAALGVGGAMGGLVISCLATGVLIFLFYIRSWRQKDAS